MPGIFSWKNRILGRKTPEPERAKQVTLTRESVNVDRDLHNHTPRRSVRFNEDQNEFAQYNVPDWQNDYGEARVIGSVTATNGMNETIVRSVQFDEKVKKNCDSKGFLTRN
ncbi:unnamed protein product [Nippostrongylus brasiliensis]|uniref:Transposase n=1 Tax=Nippostrongylus brasiliensis TaxID=27835 RepID=A0A0N4YMR9_NIPBR|nr:unnamed protein product [Nippostrongylus brasiliensis]